MSTLKADTIQNTSGGAVTLTKQSAAKFWININQITFVVADSFNNSSNTDDGAGLTTCSFVSSMNNSDYNFSANRSGNTGNTNGFLAERTSQTTSSISVSSKFFDTSSISVADTSALCASTHGDLA